MNYGNNDKRAVSAGTTSEISDVAAWIILDLLSINGHVTAAATDTDRSRVQSFPNLLLVHITGSRMRNFIRRTVNIKRMNESLVTLRFTIQGLTIKFPE